MVEMRRGGLGEAILMRGRGHWLKPPLIGLMSNI